MRSKSRTDRARRRRAFEGEAAGGAGHFGRSWPRQVVVGTAFGEAQGHGCETGLCCGGTGPADGGLQEAFRGAFGQSGAGFIDGGRLQQLAALFESAAHDGKTDRLWRVANRK